MFCSKCGKEIPNESVFCPECGNRCKGSNKSIPIDVNEHKGYIIKSLCHPITSVKEHVFGVSLKIQLIYIAIITLIIPLVKTFLFKAFSFNLVKSVVGIILEFSSVNTWDFNNMIKAKSQFDMIMENVFPTGNIYFLNLGSYVINYVLILGIIYI
ncbi:TPA: zinc-ribbon domain-containing protein, partial [Clostridium perfringens]|nr:zinc-ribbon domain-containing protein [Clostridium perfringens]HBI7039431.1 zinc-ribbon domain-containing protein [Clostridium perfringens]